MQVKCNRGYCEDVKQKPNSIKDIEERVLKAVAAYNEIIAEKVKTHKIYIFFSGKNFAGLKGHTHQAGAPVQ